MKRRLFTLILIVVLAIGLAGCKKNSEDEDVIKIGVVGESNEMWDPVIEKLADEGINIKLISFTDYSTPNQALANGEIDLNAFQHQAYLNKEISNYNYKIESIGYTFISAMNIYADKIDNVSQIKKGDKIAVPNDATNEGRALKVLEAAGLIKIDPAAGDSPELKDIKTNSLDLEFVEVDAANVYALLPDVAAAVINCNYALDYGLNPGEDSIFQDSPQYYTGNSYKNVIVARSEDKDNETYKKIVEVYQSDAVKEIYKTTFKGAYLPAWE